MIKKNFTSGLIIVFEDISKSKNHRPNPTYRLKKKKIFWKFKRHFFSCRVKGKPLFCHCPPAERLKNFFCILPYSFYVHVINSHVHPFPNEIYTPCSTPLFPSFFFFLTIISWNSSHFSTFISAHYYSDSTVWMCQNLFNHFLVAVHFGYFQMFAMFMWLGFPWTSP